MVGETYRPYISLPLMALRFWAEQVLLILVESEGVAGKGSTFTVRLPRNVKREVAARATAATSIETS